MEADAVIDALRSRISAISSVEKIMLFGSRARGDHTPHSDIDVAIFGDFSADEWRDIRSLADVDDERIRTLRKIDVVRYADASEKLRRAIIAEGKILYER